MKKIYFTLLCCMIAALGFTAKAGDVVTVNIDHPEYVNLTVEGNPVDVTGTSFEIEAGYYDTVKFTVKDEYSDIYLLGGTDQDGKKIGYFDNDGKVWYAYYTSSITEFNVTTGTADELRPNIVYVDVDDVTGLEFSRSSVVLTLENGLNQVPYGDIDYSFNIYKSEGAIYKVEYVPASEDVTGEVKYGNNAYSNYNLVNGDKIIVTNIVPDIEEPFTVKCNNWDAFKSLTINGEDVLSQIEVGASSFNHNYKIPFKVAYELDPYNFKIMRQETSGETSNSDEVSTYSPTYENNFYQDYTLDINATAYAPVNYTLNVDDIDNIYVTECLSNAPHFEGLVSGDNNLQISNRDPRIRIYPVTGAIIKSVTCDGSAVSQDYWGDYYTVEVSEGSVVTVVTEKEAMVPFKLNVTGADGITVQVNGADDYYTIVEGMNNLEIPSSKLNAGLRIALYNSGEKEYIFDSVTYQKQVTDPETQEVTIQNVEYDLSYLPSTVYLNPIFENEVIDVKVSEIVRDQSLVIMIYTPDETANYGYTQLKTALTFLKPVDTGAWHTGYSVVNFSEKENVFTCNWDIEPEDLSKEYQIVFYANDELLVNTNYSQYYYNNMPGKNGDVWKVYADFTPEKYNISFAEEGGSNLGTVVVDLFTPVTVGTEEAPTNIEALSYTQFDITPNDGVEVHVGDNVVTPDAETGKVSFRADADTKVVLKAAESGITSIDTDAQGTAVYNMQGIRIANDAENLPAGIYIIGGKKVVVRK